MQLAALLRRRVPPAPPEARAGGLWLWLVTDPAEPECDGIDLVVVAALETRVGTGFTALVAVAFTAAFLRRCRLRRSCVNADAGAEYGLQSVDYGLQKRKETSYTNGRVTATDPMNTAVPDLQQEFTQA